MLLSIMKSHKGSGCPGEEEKWESPTHRAWGHPAGGESLTPKLKIQGGLQAGATGRLMPSWAVTAWAFVDQTPAVGRRSGEPSGVWSSVLRPSLKHDRAEEGDDTLSQGLFPESIGRAGG